MQELDKPIRDYSLEAILEIALERVQAQEHKVEFTQEEILSRLAALRESVSGLQDQLQVQAKEYRSTMRQEILGALKDRELQLEETERSFWLAGSFGGTSPYYVSGFREAQRIARQVQP